MIDILKQGIFMMNCKALFFLLLSAFPALAAPMNIGGSMDLGDPGKPVPGWTVLINRIQADAVRENPAALIQTTTVPGKNGFAMQTPNAKGLLHLILRCNRFRIDRDTEVEVSFDFKCSPEEVGKLNVSLDFRTLGDRGMKALPSWDHVRYPVLKGFRIKPTAEWQHVSRKLKVIRWHNDYQVSLNVIRNDRTPLQGNVCFDNFKIRFADRPDSPIQEAAVIPDRDGGSYFKGDPVKLKINALLNSEKQEEIVTLALVADHDKTIRREFSVRLRRNTFRHEGTLEFRAERYGSFHAEILHNGKTIPTLGDLSVLHPPVRHPANTPGWGIGYNSTSSNASRTAYSKTAEELTYRNYPSLRTRTEIPYLAGMRMVRIWGYWKAIEPKEKEFQAEPVGLLIDEAARLGMEQVFCIAGSALLFPNADRNPEQAKYPHHLRKYLKPVPGRRNTLLLDGPDFIWDSFLDYCLKTWGSKIRYWEFLNEPGAAECPPHLYIRYLKHVYQRIKAADPAFQVLGNGNTCDVGFNKGWCALLSAADPDYVDFMDLCAFHPYWNSTDYINGVYGLYSKHIQELRATLKKQKPLWNTECFYIINARKPQNNFYINLEQCDPDAVQRHYLDGMLNGVKAALSLEEGSFLKFSPRVTAIPALSEMAVATNALSAHLAGMNQLRPLSLNPYLRAGIFSGENGRAVGFVYDLRPSGSTMRIPERRNVRITDLYGNPEKGTRIRQSYEPHYIFGSLPEVQRFFRETSFLPAESAKVHVRRAGGTVHVNGVNLSGVPGNFTADFLPESGLPRIQFAFRSEKDDSTASIPFTGKLPEKLLFHPNGETSVIQTAIRLSDSPEYRIGTEESRAEELPIGKHARIAFWGSETSLHFRATVEDPDLVASPDEFPWNGDALELFLDPSPFRRMDQNLILSSTPLNCYQYGFAAIPSRKGVSLRAIARAKPVFSSGAVLKQSRTDRGYRLEGRIPWNEFRLPGTQWFAMEAGIHREGKDAPLPHLAESLSGIPEKHYLHRLHYPVFRLDDELRRKLDGKSFPENADFRSGSFGEACAWGWSFQDAEHTVRHLPNGGFRGAPGVEVKAKTRPARELCIEQELSIPEGIRGIWLRALVRMDGVSSGTKTLKRHRPDGFAFRLGPWDFGNTVLSGTTGSMPWTSVECWIPIAENQKKQADLTLGLRGAAGTVTVSNINVEYIK